MDLKTYLASSPRGTATKLASNLVISSSFLSQLAAGTAPISTERAVLIEKLTDGVVTRQEMFPDSWQAKWPELSPLPDGVEKRHNQFRREIDKVAVGRREAGE